ncbi:MAG: class I SAM-dependent methyltransferase [Caulobacteraceae bacterium]|nr:class I SAM-dependent methyltransferase [Caulobacteraceae bacterium]
MDDADHNLAEDPHRQADDCPICSTPRRYFGDLPGRPRVSCPKCGSVERHRAFAGAFGASFGADGSMKGARVLALRPDRADRAMLYGFGAAKVVSFDGFPRDTPDVVGDPTAMEFGDASFDVVLDNGLLATVRDPGAVIAEMRRVLKPAGAALIYESTALDRFTVEIDDRERQISWYGEEALDAYGIGLFREWGFSDLEQLLGQSFGLGLFDTRDPVSERRYVWFFGMQAPMTSAPFMDAAQRAALLGLDDSG